MTLTKKLNGGGKRIEDNNNANLSHVIENLSELGILLGAREFENHFPSSYTH